MVNNSIHYHSIRTEHLNKSTFTCILFILVSSLERHLIENNHGRKICTTQLKLQVIKIMVSLTEHSLIPIP